MRQCSHVWPFAGLFYVFPSESFPAGSRCEHVCVCMCVCRVNFYGICRHSCLEIVIMFHLFSLFSIAIYCYRQTKCVCFYIDLLHNFSSHPALSFFFFSFGFLFFMILIISKCVATQKWFSVHFCVIHKWQYNQIVNVEKHMSNWKPESSNR